MVGGLGVPVNGDGECQHDHLYQLKSSESLLMKIEGANATISIDWVLSSLRAQEAC